MRSTYAFWSTLMPVISAIDFASPSSVKLVLGGMASGLTRSGSALAISVPSGTVGTALPCAAIWPRMFRGGRFDTTFFSIVEPGCTTGCSALWAFAFISSISTTSPRAVICLAMCLSFGVHVLIFTDLKCSIRHQTKNHSRTGFSRWGYSKRSAC